MASKMLGLLALSLFSLTLAHSGQGAGAPQAQAQAPLSTANDWATAHMQEEHHIDAFDAASFFTIHDFDGRGSWTADEIMRTYGLEDESMKHLTDEKKQEVVRAVLKLVDANRNGVVERDEWMRFSEGGGKLPDFGYGPGHHGDDEYEYEIHHFEKYHDENTKEEDLTHPEDIAHFKKHDQDADAQERQDKLDSMPIVEHNIPAKFRRGG